MWGNIVTGYGDGKVNIFGGHYPAYPSPHRDGYSTVAGEISTKHSELDPYICLQ